MLRGPELFVHTAHLGHQDQWPDMDVLTFIPPLPAVQGQCRRLVVDYVPCGTALDHLRALEQQHGIILHLGGPICGPTSFWPKDNLFFPSGSMKDWA